MQDNKATKRHNPSRRTVLKLSSLSGLLTSLPATAFASPTNPDEDDRPVSEYDSGVGTQSILSSDTFAQAISDQDFYASIDSTELTGVDVQANIFRTNLGGFPIQGDSFGVLSSGRADSIDGSPEDFESTSFANGVFIPDGAPGGYDAYNVITIGLTFTVPENATELSFTYRFGTEENPSYLGDPFQDYFSAILDTGSDQIQLASLPDDTPVTVDNANSYANSPGGTSESPEAPLPESDDTIFNSLTRKVTIYQDVSNIQGQTVTLYFQVGDGTDTALDSAAFIDALKYSEISDGGIPEYIQEKVNKKRAMIGPIRGQARFLLEDFNTGRDLSEVDSTAEEYLDKLEGIDREVSQSEEEQFDESLERLIAGEEVSQTALNQLVNDASGQTIPEHTAEEMADAVKSVAAGKLLEKTASTSRYLSSRIVKSNVFRDSTMAASDYLGNFISTGKYGDEYAEAIDIELSLAELETMRLWEQNREAMNGVYKSAVKSGFANTKFLPIPNVVEEIEQKEASLRNFTMKLFHEMALYTDNYAKPNIKTRFGGARIELPDIPNRINVPYSNAFNQASGTLSNWIDDAGDLADIKELQTLNLGALEDTDFTLPNKIDISAIQIPDSAGIDPITLDFSDEVNALESYGLTLMSGIVKELEEEVSTLEEKVAQGSLDLQDPELRQSLEQIATGGMEDVTTAAHASLEGLDLLNNIVETAESIFGLISAFAIILAAAFSIATSGVSLALLPLIGLFTELVGAVNVVVSSITGIVGFGYLNIMGRQHSAGLTKLLNSNLEPVEGVLD